MNEEEERDEIYLYDKQVFYSGDIPGLLSKIEKEIGKEKMAEILGIPKDEYYGFKCFEEDGFDHVAAVSRKPCQPSFHGDVEVIIELNVPMELLIKSLQKLDTIGVEYLGSSYGLANLFEILPSEVLKDVSILCNEEQSNILELPHRLISLL